MKKQKTIKPQNTIESLKNLISPSQVTDQLLGNFDSYDDEQWDDFESMPERAPAKPQPQTRQEFTVFNSKEHSENQTKEREIAQLEQAIKEEMKSLKKSVDSISSKVQEAEKAVINISPAEKKAGIYDVNFFEFILALIRSLRVEVSKSTTWLTAMVSKKQKRGSLFAKRSKKMGTQYSLSQELQSARSIQ